MAKQSVLQSLQALVRPDAAVHTEAAPGEAGAASTELEGGEEQDDIMVTDAPEDQDPVMSNTMAIADIALTNVSVHPDSVAWTNWCRLRCSLQVVASSMWSAQHPKHMCFRIVEVGS